MNNTHNAPDEFSGNASAAALSRFDKRLAAGFGALVLLLMTVVSLVATFSNRKIAQTHEEILSSALTGILAESINRSSFSGRYHTRRLLEEITNLHPQLSYVYVADSDYNIIAHSDPELNDHPLSERLRPVLEGVLNDKMPRFSRRDADAGTVQEIVLPYHSGYERNITGIIVAGVSLRDIQAQSTTFWIRLVLLIALLTALSLVATLGLSRYLANPVRQMAYTLQGILLHAPVYIGLFRNQQRVEQASASSYPLLEPNSVAKTWPFYVGDVDSQETARLPHIEEVPFCQEGEERTAAVTTFSVEPNATIEAPLLCSIAMDITEQRRAEAALREHRDQLETTVRERTQELEEAYTLLRQRESEITTLSNLRGALLSGGSFEAQCQAITDTTNELLGTPVALTWSVPDITETDTGAPLTAGALQLVAQTSRLSLENDGPLTISPLTTLLAGKERSIVTEVSDEPWAMERNLSALSISRLTNADGALVGVFAVYACQPFTPRHLAILEDLKTTTTYIIQANRAQQEVRQANESLVKQERLATLGELTATVSHELRNPLGIIAASFFSIERQLSDTEDPRVKRMLERGSRGIQRCDRIIEELLSFTRSSTLSTEVTTMDVWLQEELATYSFDRDISVTTTLQPDIQIAIDRQALYQCLVNLLNNACDALREVDAVEKQLRIELRRVENAIELSIHDNGPGIESAVKKQLFEPLFSTKGFGTGLGLALVQKLITLHGGRIEIQSEAGQGTTATLIIPAPEERA